MLLVMVAVAPRAGAAPFELTRTVVDPGRGRNDFFAAAVAGHGTDVLAGARFDDSRAPDAGVAYLIDAVTGSVRFTLANPAPAAGDQFGSAVASLGNDVLVGAPHADAGGPHAGAVFRFDGQTGAYRRTFSNPNPDVAELFGFSLGVVAGDLLIGAPFYNVQLRGSGATYLFDGASSEMVRSFRNPRPEEYDLFGQALSAIGGDVLIGAPFDDTAAPDGGAVYLLDPVRRTPIRTFVSPNAHPGDGFGATIAASGTLVLVGAPFDDTAASDSGAAYLFDAATGSLLRTFLDPSMNIDGRFGSAVALRGQQALVGAPFADDSAADAGIAHLFDAATGDLIESLANPTPSEGDQFGGALAMTDDALAIGAWLDDTAGPNAGALYVFRDMSVPTTTSTTTSTTLVPTTTGSTPPTTTTPGTTTTSSSTTTTTTASATTTTTETATTSTTTGSLPTTTVSTTAPEVTTTTNPPAELSCEDGDPCTADGATSAGGCVHAPLAVPEGSVCHLTELASMMGREQPQSLGGQRRQKRLLARVASVRRLIEGSNASGSARRQRRARRAIVALIATFRRAGHTGKIDPLLAVRLITRAGRAANEI